MLLFACCCICLLIVITIIYLLLNLFVYLLLQQLFAWCYIFLLVVALLVIIGVQFMLASKLHAHFTSSPMELITINVMKCLQLANLSWIWSCMKLLLISMLCKESNLMATQWRSIEGYGKLQGLVWPSFCSIDCTQIIFRNLKEFLNFFPTNPKFTTCSCK